MLAAFHELLAESLHLIHHCILANVELGQVRLNWRLVFVYLIDLSYYVKFFKRLN